MSWRVDHLDTKNEQAVHVRPFDDAIAHPMTRDCVCSPTIEQNAGSADIVIHHSLDGRELSE